MNTETHFAANAETGEVVGEAQVVIEPLYFGDRRLDNLQDAIRDLS
jgi:hypothetical protein